MKKLFSLILACFLVVAISSCKEKKPSEKVEDGIEEATEGLQEGTEEVIEDAEEAVDKAIEDASEEVKED